MELRHFDAALLDGVRATELAPTDDAGWVAKGTALLTMARLDEAVAAAKEAVAFSPDAAEEEPVRLQAPVRTFWGEHYAKEKRDPSAIDPAPWVVQYYRSKNEVRGKFKLGGRL